AKEPSGPFVVESGGTLVEAVGTQFDVYRKSDGTVVTVVEGKVAVQWPATSTALPAAPGPPVGSSPSTTAVAAHEVLVAAGEQAIVTAQAAVKSASPNVAAATAWTEGLLVFDHAPLAEVVREFNRQNARAIVLVGADLPKLEISGTFPASGADRIVHFLQERFHVEVTEDDHEIRISHP